MVFAKRFLSLVVLLFSFFAMPSMEARLDYGKGPGPQKQFWAFEPLVWEIPNFWETDYSLQKSGIHISSQPFHPTGKRLIYSDKKDVQGGFYPLVLSFKNSGSEDAELSLLIKGGSRGAFMDQINTDNFRIEVKIPAKGECVKTIYYPLATGGRTPGDYKGKVTPHGGMGIGYNVLAGVDAYVFDKRGRKMYPLVFYGSWNRDLSAPTLFSSISAGGNPELFGYGESRQPAKVKSWADSDILFFNGRNIPPDWRSLLTLKCLVLESEDVRAMEPDMGEVVRDWVSAGGRLYINGYGAAPGWIAGNYGLGRIEYVDMDNPGMMSGLGLNYRLRNEQGVHDYRSDFKIEYLLKNKGPEEQGVCGGFLILLILCAVSVLPVCYFVFMRSSGLHMRLWLLPLVAIVQIGAVLLYPYIAEGCGGEGHRVAYVTLSPVGKSALVVQSQVCRAGIMNEPGFDLPGDTLMDFKQYCHDYMEEGDLRIYSLLWKKTIHPLRGDSRIKCWLSMEQAWRTEDRAENYFSHFSNSYQNLLRRVPLEGGVIEKDRTEEGYPVVLSTMPCTFRQFRYVDQAGGRWETEELAPGREVVLSPRKEAATGTPRSSSIIPKGCFAAYGERCEGIPIPTHPEIKWTDQIIYQGMVERENLSFKR